MISLDPQEVADIFKSDKYTNYFKTPYGFLDIDRDFLRFCADACYQVEQAFPGNDYSRQAYQRKFEDGESIIKTPDPPRYPRPYRNWSEFRMRHFGGM